MEEDISQFIKKEQETIDSFVQTEPTTMAELKNKLIEHAELERKQSSIRIKEQKIRKALNKELALKKNKDRSHEEIEAEVNNRFSNVTYEGKLGKDEAVRLLSKWVTFIKIDDIDNPVALFNLDEGIYTTSFGLWYQVISWILPYSTAREKNDILHILSTRAAIKERYSKSDRIIVGNGIYNFTTKELESYNPEYVFTSKIATNYQEIHEEPCYNGWTFTEMLKDWTQGDEELAYTFWQVIRASVQLKVRKRFVLLRDNGQGRTGKGTFQTLIQSLIGRDNVLYLSMKEMEERHLLEGVENAQAIIGDDNDKSAFIDEPRVLKSLSTGDPLKINPKNRAPFNYQGNPLIIQSMNGTLRTSDMSDAFKNRILFIPFTKSYIGKENGDIKEDYIHRKEFLSWILYQALQLKDFTLFTVPKASEEAMQEFVLENDIVADFYHSVFSLFKSGRIPADLGYQIFKEWSSAVGKPSGLSRRTFTNRLLVFVAKSSEWEHSGTTAIAPLHYLTNEEEHPYRETFGDLIFGVDRKKRKTSYVNSENVKILDKLFLDEKIAAQENVLRKIKERRGNMRALDIEENERILNELKQERKNLGG